MLVVAQKASEAEEDWDKPLGPPEGVAECINAARERLLRGETPKPDWSPIHIPPGKEDTVRGRLAARINAARARMARFEGEVKAER